MTNVLSFLRSFTRTDRVVRGCLGLALLIVAWACADKVVGPTIVVPKGQIGVYADVGPAGITTLVIQVSGPGIVKADGSPDTLAFNIPLANGVASGSLDVPAGPDRVITARAFIGITETHRGSITANILAGTNPTLHVTMVPLVGSIPLTVSIGSTIVVVRPLLASVAVNDTLRLTSEIRDHNGTLVPAKVRWATLNPNKASVDTNGLVTVRDTGDVQIVGTYGTVGGASKISGVAVAAVSPIHLTWNGSVSINWSEPNNWTPHGLGVARVPTLTDSVVIPAGPARMPRLDGCVDDNAVRDILIEQGATLATSCYPLNVYKSAVIRGSVTTTINLRPNATAAGKFQDLYIYGSGTSLTDSVSAGYVEVRIPIGTFSLNGHKLRANDLYVPDGTITMADPDTLVVANSINWSGDDQTGLLTGGVVLFRGTSFYGSRYYATGTNRVVLDRTATGTQSIGGFDYVNNPTFARMRRLEIRSRDGADICSYLRVTDTLSFASTGTPASLTSCSSYRVRADGPVITTANTDVANYQWELMHATGTSLVAGTWHPSYTDFNVASAIVKPTLAYGHMRFFASNSLSGNVASTGHLWIEGTGVEFALNGHKATFAHSLTVRNGGVLKMTNAADSLILGEYAEFSTDQHGLQKPNLTAGVMSVGAYFDGFGFAASGTFKVVLSGVSASSQKYITRVNNESRPTQSFYDLEIAPSVTYGLCERVRVDHNLVVKAGATLQEWCGNSILTPVNDLVGEAGSTIKPYQIVINNPTGTSNVAGTFTPTYTDFSLTNAPVKAGLGYQNLRFFAPNHLLGATAATGHLWIEGATTELKIDGQTLNVDDYMQLQTGGMLNMTNAADVVNVAYYATFNWDGSAAHVTRLTAGVLRVGAYFDGFGFAASGTHTVELTGTHATNQKYITRVNYSSRPSQAFQNLVVTSTGSYGLCEFVAVKGTATVQAGGTLNQWCVNSNHLRVDNDLVVAASGTFSIYEAVLNNTVGTQNVVGTFTPTYTSITNTAAAGQLKPGLGYTNVQFFTAASLGADMTVNGDLNVNGAAAILTLNGKNLTVMSDLNLQSQGTIVMNNALDVLEVRGAANWNGGGSEAGKLTAGKTILKGPTFCATNYETSGAHTTSFERAGTPVRLQCVSSNGISQPMWNVDVKGAGVSLECNMNVINDIHVFNGATLNETCSGGSLWVGHILTTDAGSAVTNGTGYPATTKLAVVFEDPSGTQNVAGAYSADQSYFTALNSYIKPTLLGNGMDYKYMRIDQSTVFQDSTEIDGQLDIIGGIVDINGKRVVVNGVLNLDPPGRIKMTSANDTLVVGLNDPTADLFWDGADNATDGVNPLLTAGAIKFYGDRFYGPQYKATVTGSSHHRFIFMNPQAGTTSLEGAPRFANLEIRSPRAIVNNGATWVQDSLIMGASTTYGGTSSLEIDGDLVTGASSDLSVTNVFLDGPKGTSLVSGRYRPTNGYFRNGTPNANAIKPGLEYQNIDVQSGQYVLTTGGTTTTVTGALDINTGGRLTINGQTLNVGGALSFGSSGGGFVMNNIADAVNVTGTFQGNSGQVGSALTAGTLTVSGNYNMFVDVAATAIHQVVMTGAAAKTISSLNGGARALQGLAISGTGNVSFSSGLVINGNLQILSAVAVTGSSSTINGNISSVAGSSFTHSNLSLDGPTGTSGMNGTMSITGTMTFLSGTQTIKAGTGYSYANMTVNSAATVTGSPFAVPGTLTIGSGGSLAVPAASTLGTVNVAGTLDFLSTTTATGTLTVQSGGQALMITDLSPTSFVDFNRITINTGGTLNNYSDRIAGDGGFRRVGTNYTNNGTLIGPVPAIHP